MNFSDQVIDPGCGFIHEKVKKFPLLRMLFRHW